MTEMYQNGQYKNAPFKNKKTDRWLIGFFAALKNVVFNQSAFI